MTEKSKKRRKLSHEILALFAVCLAVTLALYFLLTFLGIALAEEYCFNNDIVLDEYDLYRLDTTVFGAGIAVAAVFFTVFVGIAFSDAFGMARYVPTLDEIESIEVDNV